MRITDQWARALYYIVLHEPFLNLEQYMQLFWHSSFYSLWKFCPKSVTYLKGAWGGAALITRSSQNLLLLWQYLILVQHLRLKCLILIRSHLDSSLKIMFIMRCHILLIYILNRQIIEIIASQIIFSEVFMILSNFKTFQSSSTASYNRAQKKKLSASNHKLMSFKRLLCHPFQRELLFMLTTLWQKSVLGVFPTFGALLVKTSNTSNMPHSFWYQVSNSQHL